MRIENLRLQVMNYSGLNIRNKKWFETKMKITINLYCKGNEIIFWCAFRVWLCFPLMIIVVVCTIVNNASYTISKCVELIMTMSIKIFKWFLVIKYQLIAKCVDEKCEKLLLYMYFNNQNNNYENILKNIIGCNVFIFAQT
jgi:hypothetical protein